MMQLAFVAYDDNLADRLAGEEPVRGQVGRRVLGVVVLGRVKLALEYRVSGSCVGDFLGERVRPRPQGNRVEAHPALAAHLAIADGDGQQVVEDIRRAAHLGHVATRLDEFHGHLDEDVLVVEVLPDELGAVVEQMLPGVAEGARREAAVPLAGPGAAPGGVAELVAAGARGLGRCLLGGGNADFDVPVPSVTACRWTRLCSSVTILK